MTGLSDLAFPPDGPLSKWGEDQRHHQQQQQQQGFLDLNGEDVESWQFTIQRYMGVWTAAVFSLIAFVSPIFMVAIPQMDIIQLRESQLRCDVRQSLT